MSDVPRLTLALGSISGDGNPQTWGQARAALDPFYASFHDGPFRGTTYAPLIEEWRERLHESYFIGIGFAHDDDEEFPVAYQLAFKAALQGAYASVAPQAAAITAHEKANSFAQKLQDTYDTVQDFGIGGALIVVAVLLFLRGK